MISKSQPLLIEIIVNVSFYNPQFLWNEHFDRCVVVGKYNDNNKNEHSDSYVIVWKLSMYLIVNNMIVVHLTLKLLVIWNLLWKLTNWKLLVTWKLSI